MTSVFRYGKLAASAGVRKPVSLGTPHTYPKLLMKYPGQLSLQGNYLWRYKEIAHELRKINIDIHVNRIISTFRKQGLLQPKETNFQIYKLFFQTTDRDNLYTIRSGISNFPTCQDD
ncbi:MAG: hypothetical protein ISR78_00650 [Spirochaetia bacterium]|nr:hypothetical protein [Spirochaetia bacterium]